MFHIEESPKAWAALILLGCAAICIFAEKSVNISTVWHSIAALIAAVLIGLSLFLASPSGSLNRKISTVFKDAYHGKSPSRTPIQRIVTILAFVLLVFVVGI